MGLPSNIWCPYCGKHESSTAEEHWAGSPPMQNTLYIIWSCGNCTGSFETSHELNDNGGIL